MNIEDKIPRKTDSNESFEDYYIRWPQCLSQFPKCVIRQWAYDHNSVFLEKWSEYDLTNWQFSLVNFSKDDLSKIDHFSNERKEYIEKGIYWLENNGQSELEDIDVVTYMIKHGTFPCPIIVGINGGHLIHPKSRPGEMMVEPYQILEGHTRWATALAFLEKQPSGLLEKHEIWLVDLKLSRH